MMDMLIHKWWLWLGRILFAIAMWYGYEGMEVDNRHADLLDRVDEREREIDKEIKDVEIELQDAEFQVQRVRVSVKLVKLVNEKSQFMDESMHKSVRFYIERQNTIINFLIFFIAGVLVWYVGPRLQSGWRRWSNWRRLRAAAREEEAPVDE